MRARRASGDPPQVPGASPGADEALDEAFRDALLGGPSGWSLESRDERADKYVKSVQAKLGAIVAAQGGYVQSGMLAGVAVGVVLALCVLAIACQLRKRARQLHAVLR